MILWTIQTSADWQRWQTEHLLRARPQAPFEAAFRPAYRWMTEQMRARLPAPSTTATGPVWAWYQYRDCAKRRPDLRESGHLDRKERGVLVEVEVDAERVLLSDYDLWHLVLMGHYIPTSEADRQQFERACARMRCDAHRPDSLPPRLSRRVVASWDRALDLDFAPRNIASPRRQKQIQATLWEISQEEVRRVRPFTAR